MIIVGAGMAGLLAANMLRREVSAVVEAQSEIPNNHSAVLRFRGSAVGDVLGIPFRKVQVMKAVQTLGNPIADALAYSKKTNGTYALRSIASASGSIETRYIAPPDLIAQMVKSVDHNQLWLETNYDFKLRPSGVDTVISTIPMPVLMKELGWRDTPEFEYVEGVNIKAHIQNADAYVSLYQPDPSIDWYRASITGNELIVELCGDHDTEHGWAEEIVEQACHALGIDITSASHLTVSKQAYAKIQPIDDDVRKRFILWATEKHNVYSLGRFATWRPGLLLDDVVDDVRHIQAMIHSGHSYDKRLRANR